MNVIELVIDRIETRQRRAWSHARDRVLDILRGLNGSGLFDPADPAQSARLLFAGLLIRAKRNPSHVVLFGDAGEANAWTDYVLCDLGREGASVKVRGLTRPVTAEACKLTFDGIYRRLSRRMTTAARWKQFRDTLAEFLDVKLGITP